jgi:hypothetical protein
MNVSVVLTYLRCFDYLNSNKVYEKSLRLRENSLIEDKLKCQKFPITIIGLEEHK